MGLPIGDETLYTTLFAEEQVLISGHRDDSAYILRILKQQFKENGLILNAKKTEYMIVCNDDNSDFDIGTGTTIKRCTSFKYLGFTLISNGKALEA